MYVKEKVKRHIAHNVLRLLLCKFKNHHYQFVTKKNSCCAIIIETMQLMSGIWIIILQSIDAAIIYDLGLGVSNTNANE